MKKRTALVLGASGLVGQEVVHFLLNSHHYSSVTIIARTQMAWEHEKLHQIIVDLNMLEQQAAAFMVDDVYSCLGTTIKKAKTKENFLKVDYGYTMQAARLAQIARVRNFLVISSMGASAKSIFFYSQVKGLVEEELKSLSIRGIHIFRPSLLLGERDEFRLGERIAEKVSGILPFIYKGALAKYKPIEAEQVAKGMYKVAISDMSGIHIYESGDINHM